LRANAGQDGRQDFMGALQARSQNFRRHVVHGDIEFRTDGALE
jgi:hypothetical protein